MVLMAVFIFILLVCLQWMLSENVQNFDDVKFDAASLIAKLYQEQNQSIMAKQVLRKALQISQHNVYWHCRLLFQLAVSYCSFYDKTIVFE